MNVCTIIQTEQSTDLTAVIARVAHICVYIKAGPLENSLRMFCRLDDLISVWSAAFDCYLHLCVVLYAIHCHI